MKDPVAVTVEGLRKRYGQVTAVDGVSFEMRHGEILGMVGPNGAGKTTTIECIEGLRRPDEGTVRVLGLDPWRDEQELRERTGVQLQTSSLPRNIQVGEALDLFASFYRHPADWHPLLESLGLADKQRALASQLSGGQRQRLFVALALINNPEVVFLDELTTGLDPQARRAIWDLVRSIRDRGTTVFLTTHYMEEAERLCDRVAIMDGGKIIALDTPPNLVRSLSIETRVIFEVDGHGPSGQPQAFDPATLGTADGVKRVERDGDRVVVYGQGRRLVSGIVMALESADVSFQNLRTEQPDLEDVFLAQTGRQMRD
jgi:ABC-2 type transport system ATP-binding protein